jgi:antitoxin component YwqK of YwqJK toxin-antitoxin module
LLAGSRKPNFEVDKTKGQFEDHLSNNGFDKSVISTPKGPINVFSKNGQKEFTTRGFSKSTDGPSGEIFKNGKPTGKIRFPNE